jgi:L-glutamine---4-(methylsulfanyl)-2-oxobutanoate aminotransferase
MHSHVFLGTEFSPLAMKYGACNLGQGFPNWRPPEFVERAAVDAIQGNIPGTKFVPEPDFSCCISE